MTDTDMTVQGARPSVAMLLIHFSGNIPVSAPEGLIIYGCHLASDMDDMQ